MTYDGYIKGICLKNKEIAVFPGFILLELTDYSIAALQ